MLTRTMSRCAPGQTVTSQRKFEKGLITIPSVSLIGRIRLGKKQEVATVLASVCSDDHLFMLFVVRGEDDPIDGVGE